MRVLLVVVGRVKDRDLRGAIDEYLKRVRRYVACDEIELKDDAPARLQEAMNRATGGATVVALEVGGRTLDSPTFARSLERMGSRGKGVVAFLIGGADGIPPETSKAAHERWSL